MSVHTEKQRVILNREFQTINYRYSFLNKLPRSVGIEYDHKVGNGNAKVKPFDSLTKLIDFGRDDHNELRTLPAKGDALITNLLIVKEIAKRSKPEGYRNWGLHVHVDALDLTTPELLRFVYIYQYIEEVINKYVIHPGRKRSPYNYSVFPLQSTTDKTKTGLAAFCYKVQTAQMLQHVFQYNFRGGPLDFNSQRFQHDGWNPRTRWWPHQLGRYTIAMYQLGEHGTVEFRGKEAVAGTDPVEDVVYWPLFCGWLIESVKHVSDHEIVKILNPNYVIATNKEINTFNFLNKFIPAPIVHWFTNHAYASM